LAEIDGVNQSNRSNSVTSPGHCPICQEQVQTAGSVHGKFVREEFKLWHCPRCHFSYVGNPVLDYGRIYTEAYYHGQGADPLVDYYFELDHRELAVRQYEWRGLLRLIRELKTVTPATCWLDYGCGNGGLVRYAREQGLNEVFGFDEGAIVSHARKSGIPFLSRAELDGMKGRCDVVTAVEVLEHVPDPLSVLREIREFLKPGGLFFFTTGNARPYRGRLTDWGYVIPEIHVSFFEPETLVRALAEAGFQTEFRKWSPGWRDILRFKILKNLHVRKTTWCERLLPWPVLARIANWKYDITGHPIARLQGV
jgi:SAM-dependent methyltransferase